MSRLLDEAKHLPVETEEMYGVFSSDRTRLLSNCLRVFTGHKEPITALAWAEDQQLVASGAFDREVRLWDVASGKCSLRRCSLCFFLKVCGPRPAIRHLHTAGRNRAPSHQRRSPKGRKDLYI